MERMKLVPAGPCPRCGRTEACRCAGLPAAPAPAPKCPTCLDNPLKGIYGLAPGLENVITLFQCEVCNLSWTPHDLERRWSVDGQILDCFRADSRRGAPGGGSGGTKGRREDKPGMRQAREEKRRNRPLELVPQPLGTPDPDPWAKGQDRLTSAVKSVRLNVEERETFQRLASAYGCEKEGDVIRRALEVADAVESARPKEAA